MPGAVAPPAGAAPAAGAAAPPASADKGAAAKAAEAAAGHSAEKAPLAKGADYLSEFESELDAIDKGEQTPPASGARKADRGRVAAPAEAGKNGAAGQSEKPEGETELEGEEDVDKGKPKEGEAGNVEHEEGPEPGNLRDLRNSYRELRKRIKQEYKPKVATLEARVKELEENAKNGTNPDLQKELDAAKTRNQELENEITFTNYSRSAEFQEKYHKPYVQAWTQAVSVFSQLQVRQPDGKDEDGNPKFKLRAATQDDLLELANLPLSKMDEAAEEMFGKSAARVIRHVERVKELADAETQALEGAHKAAGDRIKQQTETQEANKRKGREMWTAEHKRLSTKYGNLFGPRKGDDAGNAMLDKGRELAERIFGDDPKLKPKTAEEAVRLHALAYNKIVAHGRAVHLWLQERKARQEAEKALKAYEESGAPGRTRSGSRPPAAGNWKDEADAELDKLDVV